MRNLNPLLFTDGYKLSHKEMYPEGTTLVYSNFTPRSSRVDGVNHMVFFGLQYAMKEYLVDRMNKDFFLRDKSQVVGEYKRRIENYLGTEQDVSHIEALHDLGYLPIKIKALPEGTRVPMGTPAFTVVNTHPDFFWLTNYLETMLSSLIWKPCTSATTAYEFKKLFVKYGEQTGADLSATDFQGHDFSFRGMSNPEDACLSGAAHLLSFKGSDSVPAIDLLETYYGADSDRELVGCSVPACYDDKTEVLTNHGFKLFNKLNKTDLIAQFNKDSSIDFVKLSNYYECDYNGQMIHFSKSSGYNNVDILVTPNHKMVRLNQSSNEINLFEAGDFSYGNRKGYSCRNKLVISGKYSSIKNKLLSSLDMLKIAFQADGSYPSRKNKYTGEKTKTKPIRFTLKKKRKQNRLEAILLDLNFEYNISIPKNRSGYKQYWIKVPIQYDFVKDFSWVEIDKYSLEELKGFISELRHWDGTKKNNCIVYSTTNKECIDKVQAICVVSNFKTHYNRYIDKRGNRQPLHSIVIKKQQTLYSDNIIRKKIDYNGKVYCVSVPSKMIIVRRNNKVVICGNTEHSVMCAGGQDSELDTIRRLFILYPTGILSLVSDTWDFWKLVTEYLPILKNEIMGRYERDPSSKLVIRPDSYVPHLILNGEPESNTEHQKMGLINCLGETFGYTFNDKGFKKLHPCIGAIYGDGINVEEATRIFDGLKSNGYETTNVVLGLGSFTYQYCTRDTYGTVCKATYVKINGEGRPIFKAPKTGAWKKSHKGLLRVNEDLTVSQDVTWEQEKEGLLQTVFENGEIIKASKLCEIRERLNAG